MKPSVTAAFGTKTLNIIGNRDLAVWLANELSAASLFVFQTGPRPGGAVLCWGRGAEHSQIYLAEPVGLQKRELSILC